MMYRFSSQGAQFGRIPGGGLGCLLGVVVVGVVTYYMLKGLYVILWWAAPALVVLTLIINWRVIPETIKNWIDSLESRPLYALASAAFAVLAFPFFALWLFLKAVGYRKLETMKKQFQGDQAPPAEEEFVEFEEIESRPMARPPEPEIIEEPKKPEAQKPKKEENPYDGFFG